MHFYSLNFSKVSILFPRFYLEQIYSLIFQKHIMLLINLTLFDFFFLINGDVDIAFNLASYITKSDPICLKEFIGQKEVN